VNAGDLEQLKSTIDELSYQLAEAQRQLQLVSGMTGTVVSWDPETHTAVADLGYETHAIPVGDAPGDFTPMAQGQLVHVIAPSGKLDNAYLIPAGYSGQQKPPSSKTGERVVSLPGGGQFKSLTGDIAHVVAGGVTQFVLVLGGQKFTIKPEALNPA
jgi:phage baseplate assembly protein gpV